VGVLLDTFATGLHAVQRARVQNGDTVVVQGTGAVGLSALAAAKLAGATKAIAIGAHPEKVAYASLFGADVTIDITETTDPAERLAIVKKETPGGYGADVVFGCTATPTSISEGLALTRKSGTYCEVGNFCDTGPTSLNVGLEVVQKDISFLGIFAQTIEHFARGMVVLEKMAFPYDRLVTHRVPLEQVGEIVKGRTFTREGRAMLKVVADPWL
jgi:L-iditol 2-dehydrogenase